MKSFQNETATYSIESRYHLFKGSERHAFAGISKTSMLMLLLRRLQLLCLLQVLLLLSAQPPVWPLHRRNLVLAHTGRITTFGDSSHGSRVCSIQSAQATFFKIGHHPILLAQLLHLTFNFFLHQLLHLSGAPVGQKNFRKTPQKLPHGWTLFMLPSDCVPATAVFRFCDRFKLGKVCNQNHTASFCHPRFNIPCTKGAQTCTRAVQKCTKCRHNAPTGEPSTFQHRPVRARCAMILCFAQLVSWLCHLASVHI